MEPMSMLIGALAAGAVAASKDVAEQAIKDTYAGLRALLKRKFGESSKLARAVDDLASDPEDKQYKESASYRLQEAEAHKDPEVVSQAKKLLDLLKEKGEITEATYQVTVQGSGAAAVGEGATAAGERGVAIGGGVSGSTIVTGNRNMVGSEVRESGSRNESDRAESEAASAAVEQAVQEGDSAQQSLIKILFLAANPLNTKPLRLDEEMRSIDQAMQQGAFRDRFDIRQHWAVRISDLHELLLRHQPDIVHFSGHGSAASEIILQNASGKSVIVPADSLTDLFRVLKDNIRCVVLNACYSDEQAAGIAKFIDCVIGMSDAITDKAAIHFATSFYRALAYGRTVETAFELGLSQIDLHDLDDADLPQLLGQADPARVRLVQP